MPVPEAGTGDEDATPLPQLTPANDTEPGDLLCPPGGLVYSTASVHQMATLLRSGKMALFAEAKPGPKGPRKATGELREWVLALRAAQHSISEIAEAMTTAGLPVSAQTVWQILSAQGLGRLLRRDEGRRGSPARLDPVKAGPLPGWPAGQALVCDHAGLLLLFPAMARLGLSELIGACGYPSSRALSAWQSIATLLLAKCTDPPRRLAV